MRPNEIDTIRDAALFLEDKNIELAYELMSIAGKYRPKGQFIKNKISEYKPLVKLNNSFINIHLGVHKTATTFIQENLDLINDPEFYYINLDKFREIRQKLGYYPFLRTIDWSKYIYVTLSDENLVGSNGTILTGKLYPQFGTLLDRYLRPFKNREKIKIFISIRPMVYFVPSQYCEYLRWNDFISYIEFTKQVEVHKMSWQDTLLRPIKEQSDITFYIFDFLKFKSSGLKLFQLLSFNKGVSFSQLVKPSRESFSNKYLFDLSGGDCFYKENDHKFSPHSKYEKKQSLEQYSQDLAKLKELSNVSII